MCRVPYAMPSNAHVGHESEGSHASCVSKGPGHSFSECVQDPAERGGCCGIAIAAPSRGGRTADHGHHSEHRGAHHALTRKYPLRLVRVGGHRALRPRRAPREDLALGASGICRGLAPAAPWSHLAATGHLCPWLHPGSSVGTRVGNPPRLDRTGHHRAVRPRTGHGGPIHSVRGRGTDTNRERGSVERSLEELLQRVGGGAQGRAMDTTQRVFHSRDEGHDGVDLVKDSCWRPTRR